MSFYGLRDWKIENTNVQKLSSRVNAMKNSALLQFDMKAIAWEEYFKTYIPGIKKYYFKEDPAKSAEVALKYKR